jgi:predicted phosphodiesterase
VLAEKPDYLLFGHFHIASDATFGGVRCINPGALANADSFSVAVLDLASDDLRFFEIPA